jgi:hypothetical protein
MALIGIEPICLPNNCRVHIGDTANLVTSYAADADHIVTGAIVIEPQVRMF